LDREQQIIKHTRLWLESIIVKCGFCPFAKPVLEQNSIHYNVISTVKTEQILEALLRECLLLDVSTHVETSLIILDKAYQKFDDYLHFVDISELLLKDQGYEGVYQLASFHPDYCFEGATMHDPANYTNRSVYPMLHLLRESSVTNAVAHHGELERIPERNIQYARRKGLAQMQSMLAACKKVDEKGS